MVRLVQSQRRVHTDSAGGIAGVAMLAMLGFFAAMGLFAPVAAPRLDTMAQPHGVPAQDPNAPVDHPLLTVPIAGYPRSRIIDSWGDPRENGLREHHGTDIMAPQGTPVIAAAPGTVEKLFFSHGGGGTTVYVRSPDRLWSYYYAHLSGYAPGLHEGQVVKAGDPIGFVGDTGNAGEGNFHLHFGMQKMLPTDGWWQGEAINPFPLLAGRPARR